MAALRGQDRPVCQLWQRGRCTLSSLQCDFRHANDGPLLLPSLGAPFEPEPEPRGRQQRWRDDDDDLMTRRPLQEIWIPAPATSIRDEDPFFMQQIDEEYEHVDSECEDGFHREADCLAGAGAFNTMTGTVGVCGLCDELESG